MDAVRTVLTVACKRIAAFAPPILGAVWVAAAWAKIVHPGETIAALRRSAADVGVDITTDVRWPLLILIAIELSLGFGLIFEVAPKRLVIASASLLALLTAWVGFLVTESPKSPCGCGLRFGWWESGGIAQAAWTRNLVLLGIHAAVLACLERRGVGCKGSDSSTCALCQPLTNGDQP